LKSIASLSSTTDDDHALTLCENEFLIYSQNANQLTIRSLKHSTDSQTVQFDRRIFIRDLCFVDWLRRCLVICNDSIYLLDYRTYSYKLLEFGFDYRCAAIDNLHGRFYLIERSTLNKYDRYCLKTQQADQYPIAVQYQCQSICLDNQTNESLALLVRNHELTCSVLVYSTRSFSDGYLYKIVIDDHLERTWICSNDDFGWFIRDIEFNRYEQKSCRKFHRFQITNLKYLSKQFLLLRTRTEIFLLNKNKSLSH